MTTSLTPDLQHDPLALDAHARALLPPLPTPRQVVAVALEWRDHVLLLKRSQRVEHDRGKWHCVTGYIEKGQPLQQAIDELYEETGLRLLDLTALEEGPVLLLPDGHGQEWPVHTYRAQTHQRRLTLNWEHTAYRWVRPSRLSRFDGRVTWLDDVIRAVQAPPDSASARRPNPGSESAASCG